MDYQDFRLDEFLRVSKDIDFPTPNGFEKVTVRVLSDLEQNAKWEYATAVKVSLVTKLRDPETAEYAKYIRPLDISTRADLTKQLLEYWQNEYIRQAQELYPYTFAPLPDDPKEEEVVENRITQQLLDGEVLNARAKYVVDAVAAYATKAEGLSDALLLSEAKDKSVWLYSAILSLQEERNYKLWRAVVQDGKPKVESAEAVKELPQRIIAKLIEAYDQVDSIDPWELTKSLSERATDRVDDTQQSETTEPDS